MVLKRTRKEKKAMSRYTQVRDNSPTGGMLRDLKPGEDASVVSGPHYGKTGYEVDADLYRRNDDGKLVKDNSYHTHLDPYTLDSR